MSRLLLLKHQTEEDARSPEFRYLLSLCSVQARRVFDAVEETIWDGGPAEPEPHGDGDYVLVLGRENVFVSAASLERMRAVVDQGAEVALTSPLASFPVLERVSLYTLRGFEHLERRIFDEGHKPLEVPRSHLPASLFAGAFFPTLRSRFAVSEVLTNRSLLSELGREEPAAAGIHHHFADYYGEPREDVLDHLPATAEDVLEIGCGRGLTGKLIQDRLGCRVTGVELNPIVAREAAGNLERVIVGDVLEVEIPGRYDAVVATELFEHLTEPERFLARMKSVLRPGGRIVLSVPNVGHHAVVEDLLAGRWDYLPIGLLCYTHFRFFTRSTLDDWTLRAGFSSSRIIPQRTELPSRFAELAGAWEVDLESLGAKGFWVVLTV